MNDDSEHVENDLPLTVAHAAAGIALVALSAWVSSFFPLGFAPPL